MPLTIAEQKRQDARDFLNQYVASERFLTRRVMRNDDPYWQEALAFVRGRQEALRQQLAEEAIR